MIYRIILQLTLFSSLILAKKDTSPAAKSLLNAKVCLKKEKPLGFHSYDRDVIKQQQHGLISSHSNHDQLEDFDFETFVVYHVEKVKICFEHGNLSGLQFFLDNYLGRDMLYGEVRLRPLGRVNYKQQPCDEIQVPEGDYISGIAVAGENKMLNYIRVELSDGSEYEFGKKQLFTSYSEDFVSFDSKTRLVGVYGLYGFDIEGQEKGIGNLGMYIHQIGFYSNQCDFEIEEARNLGLFVFAVIFLTVMIMGICCIGCYFCIIQRGVLCPCIFKKKKGRSLEEAKREIGQEQQHQIQSNQDETQFSQGMQLELSVQKNEEPNTESKLSIQER